MEYGYEDSTVKQVQLIRIQWTLSNIHPVNIHLSLLATVVTERISPYINSPAYINLDIIPRWYPYQHISDFIPN